MNGAKDPANGASPAASEVAQGRSRQGGPRYRPASRNAKHRGVRDQELHRQAYGLAFRSHSRPVSVEVTENGGRLPQIVVIVGRWFRHRVLATLFARNGIAVTLLERQARYRVRPWAPARAGARPA